MLWVYPRLKKWDMGITINGFLGGLVAITCPCYWVNSTGAVIIGAIAGPIVVIGIDVMEHLRIDDPIGAVAVHGCAGIWGTWSLGLFSTGQFGVPKGLLWGGNADQLFAQVWGNAVIGIGAFVVTYAMMRAIKVTRTLRISEAGEFEGIDIHEHGFPAYHPEPAYMGNQENSLVETMGIEPLVSTSQG